MNRISKPRTCFSKENEAFVYTVCLHMLQSPDAARCAAARAMHFALLHQDDCPCGQLRIWLCRIAVRFAADCALHGC